MVILPAFGATLEEMQHLDEKGVTTVDTTCPWVSKVWTTVDKHELAEMTSIIHGKYQHEEAIATGFPLVLVRWCCVMYSGFRTVAAERGLLCSFGGPTTQL